MEMDENKDEIDMVMSYWRKGELGQQNGDSFHGEEK